MSDNPSTTTVKTLTAEVRVLMVGSRQITLSVYGQLDDIPDIRITPMGRVAPKDAQAAWVYVVGKDSQTGALARSSLPYTTSAINREIASLSRAPYSRKMAEDANRNAASCDRDAADLDETAAKLTDGNSSYIKVGDNHLESVPYATENAARHKSDADTAAAAALAAKADVERLKATADEASALYRAESSLQAAQEAVAVAGQLRTQAAELRERAQAWRTRAQQATRTAETNDENDELERDRIAEVSAEWSALPLIVLAGLR